LHADLAARSCKVKIFFPGATNKYLKSIPVRQATDVPAHRGPQLLFTAAAGQYLMVTNSSATMIFHRNSQTFKYDFVHEYVGVAPAALMTTNGRWFAIHSKTNNQTELFELDDTFQEINTASIVHDAKFIHLQRDNSLISVSNSIDTYQKSIHGSWEIVDSLPIPIPPYSANFGEDRIVFHHTIPSEGGTTVYFYTRQNGTWSFIEEIQYHPNVKGEYPAWNGDDTLVFRIQHVGLGISTKIDGEWIETTITNEEIGAESALGRQTIFLDNNTFVVDAFSSDSSRTGSFIFKRQPSNNNNNNNTWQATHQLYGNFTNEAAFYYRFAVNEYDIMFPRMTGDDLQLVYIDALGRCFDEKPNITCSLQLDSCSNVDITPSDLYVVHDPCPVSLEPIIFDLHLDNIYGNMSFNLKFSRSGIDTSCTSTISCPFLPDGVTSPSSNVNPISVNSPMVVNNGNTYIYSLSLYCIALLLSVFSI
jgi:hypothetical protein